MDNDKIIALTKAFPQYKCLRCTNFWLADRTCQVNMTPETCGRAFNPKNGGEADPIQDPPIKPRPKDGVELKIPQEGLI